MLSPLPSHGMCAPPAANPVPAAPTLFIALHASTFRIIKKPKDTDFPEILQKEVDVLLRLRKGHFQFHYHQRVMTVTTAAAVECHASSMFNNTHHTILKCVV